MIEELVMLDEWLKDEDAEFGGNGLDRDGVEKLGAKLKALGVEVFVKVGQYGTDELYLKTRTTVSRELAVAIGDARPDECDIEDDMIRLWWD